MKMKERPIIFSAESVRAILSGRKTQTRRVVTCPPYESGDDGIDILFATGKLKCKYGEVGDRLWVRETFYLEPNGTGYRVVYQEQVEPQFRKDIKWTAPLFLSKVNSRLTLEIVSVRVARLRDISEVDALAEGCFKWTIKGNEIDTARNDFAQLWDALNAKRSYGWDTNPWVWVLEFKKL